MDEKDLPSSSDESDADFVPTEKDYDSGSGSEVSDFESFGEDDQEHEKKLKKRKKATKRSVKKPKTSKNEVEEKRHEDRNEKEEKTETDIDALYADFKKDVNNTILRKTDVEMKKNETLLTKSDESNENSDQTKSLQSTKNKNIPNFMNKSKKGGLSNILSQIGKKDKMSTLEKSQLDWNNFKKSEGIEEEIKIHNRGKDGYLDKQDFLQRTDLRQFEIEKGLRSARRKF